ncbi:hypothetical protein JW926_02235 [Candidatus Sumerlaeota bacterium]|nr:hypothetical protein [Candidatus Sumerlaeota bacterium]
MKHITKYNLAYLVSILVLFGLSVVTGAYFKKPAIPVLGLSVLLLFPGAIQRFYWHEFFLGRRLILLGKLHEAKEHFDKFLDQLQTYPWLKKLIHLRWTAYTGSIEAMAWSNLGMIHINRGEIDSAETAFLKASGVDPDYPVPFFNLSLIALLKDNQDDARRLWQKARDLGYRKGNFEQMLELAKNVKRTISERT